MTIAADLEGVLKALRRLTKTVWFTDFPDAINAFVRLEEWILPDVPETHYVAALHQVGSYDTWRCVLRRKGDPLDKEIEVFCANPKKAISKALAEIK